jgi:hypothetical protein
MPPRLKDRSGQRFGEMVVVELAGRRPRPGRSLSRLYWYCRCSCGAFAIIADSNLKTAGRSHVHVAAQDLTEWRAETERLIADEKAKRADAALERARRTAARRAAAAVTLGTRNSWYDMIQRCTNPKVEYYPDYGGRGIRVCERWLSFDAFLADMGIRPDGLTLDRIDTNGDYEPGNCRWATRKEQSRNTRATRLTESEAAVIGARLRAGHRVVDIARDYAINKGTIASVKAGRSWRDVSGIAARNRPA